MRLDAHQHFWKYDAAEYEWIDDEMNALKKDFFPKDLLPHLQQNNFDGCVAVQAKQSEEETFFLNELAEKNNFIKAVVGWIDLRADNLEEKFEYFSKCRAVKGFRHVLQGEANRALMLENDFKKGIALLEKFNFTYDILIFNDQLKYIPEFVAAFPNQKFVIDHIAKPGIKNQQINNWKKEMEEVSKFENVYCKISGMVTEADWKNWKQEDFNIYIDVVMNSFSAKRVMFGSDWPVCLIAASYNEVCNIVETATQQFSVDEKRLLWGINCKEFYNI